MKRILFLLFCGLAAAITSCKDDDAQAPDLRLFPPRVSDVSGTAASVECSAAFDVKKFAAGGIGFAYGPAGDAPETYTATAEAVLDGNLLTGRLTGLAPETDYRVFAFVGTAERRVVSETTAFRTLAVAADRPVIEITSLTTLSVPASRGDYKITYTLLNPTDVPFAEAESETAPWIHFFDAAAGEISFTVDANTGEEREAAIAVTYPGAETRFVTVRQAGGADPEPDRKIVLTPETPGWPGSYGSGSAQIGDYTYSIQDVAVFSDKIQFKSGSGYLSNTEALGPIRRVELVYESTPDKNIRLMTGESLHPAYEIEGIAAGDRVVFDCAGSPHTYFALQNGPGVSYLRSITIECGDAAPDPFVPTFGSPLCSDVTETEATLRCDFAYEGYDYLIGLYFLVAEANQAGLRYEVENKTGTATCRVTGLKPRTTYTFRLCAEIGDGYFTSAEAVFTTAGQSENPGGNMPYPGWAELPTEVEKSGDYHYLHKFSDGARNYTVCYSEKYHCAVWTAHPSHRWYMDGDAGRASFGYDPEIERSLQPTLSGTYKPSTYHRGHMVASSDRQRTKSMNKQVFYYTNMAPQIQNEFNGGIWNKLEQKIQDVYTCADTLYVVTGSHFGDPSKTCKDTPGNKTVVVPTHFYKVLLRTKGGNTGRSVRDLPADQLKCCVFWLEHSYKYGTKGTPSRSDMITVEEAERRTGFTFFPNVPNAPKGTMNPSDWGM